MRDQISKGRLVTGWVLTGLAVAFLVFDFAIKLTMIPAVSQSMTQLGWPVELARPIGVLEAILLLIYLIPRTSVFGAVLWTGYLGGAIATHARLQNPLFSHVLFPIYVATLLWGGLWLRSRRLQSLVPLTAES